MITKQKAINQVQNYIDNQNKDPNIHTYKIPIYNSLLKRIQVYILEEYWKAIKGRQLEYPENYINPNSYKIVKAVDVIVKEQIEDLDICWSIPYCSEQLYNTKNGRFSGIGIGPIFVDKDTGLMYETGSSPINWIKSYEEFKNGTKNPNEFPSWESIH